MLTELSQYPNVVGAKQVRRAIENGTARKVFLAHNADPRLTEPLARLCADKGVETEAIPAMKELGRACGIAVPAAVAAILAG